MTGRSRRNVPQLAAGGAALSSIGDSCVVCCSSLDPSDGGVRFGGDVCYCYAPSPIDRGTTFCRIYILFPLFSFFFFFLFFFAWLSWGM